MSAQQDAHAVLEAMCRKYGPAGAAALLAELDYRGELDPLRNRMLAEIEDEIRSDRPAGRLGEAVEIIERVPPTDAKRQVLAAGISRRTYFRARRECQECQARK